MHLSAPKYLQNEYISRSRTVITLPKDNEEERTENEQKRVYFFLSTLKTLIKNRPSEH
jgi:hypothetical protein